MRLKKRLIKTGGVIMKLFLLFIFGWPFFWMISTSLQTIDEVNRVTPTFFPAVLQFHNYLDAWHSGPAGGMWIYLKNSIIVVLSVILLQMLVVVPAAYAFAKYEFKGKKIMFGSILIALMMPTQITFLPVYLMMSKWGLINSLLPQILPFITNAFAIFLLRQYFMQVENELIEAAKLDGAGYLRIYAGIMLPLCKPALVTLGMFTFVGNWNNFVGPLIYLNTEELFTLPLIINSFRSAYAVDWGLLMAGSTVAVLPLLLIYLFAQRSFIEGIAATGLKG